MDDRGEVSKLQKGHGEWNDSMSVVSSLLVIHVLTRDIVISLITVYHLIAPFTL